MIKSFASKETERVYNRQFSKKLPEKILFSTRMKVEILDAAEVLDDLRIPPGNPLEKLSGDQSGYYGFRINQQWRICFRWKNENAYDVEIIDYH